MCFINDLIYDFSRCVNRILALTKQDWRKTLTHLWENFAEKKNNKLASHLIPSTHHLSHDPLRRSDTEAGKQEPKRVGAGQTPKCGGWKVLTLHWLSGELGVRWVWEGKISLLVCVNWARVSRACYSLSAGWPGETGLPSPAALLPAASPNATFIKGTSDTGSVSHSSHSGWLVIRPVTTDWAERRVTVRYVKRQWNYRRCYTIFLVILFVRLLVFHRFTGLCLYTLDQGSSNRGADKTVNGADTVGRVRGGELCVFGMREQAWCGCEH